MTTHEMLARVLSILNAGCVRGSGKKAKSAEKRDLLHHEQFFKLCFRTPKAFMDACSANVVL
jgi:hypothetical protein